MQIQLLVLIALIGVMVMVFNATFNNMTSNVKFKKLNENLKK